MHAHEARRLGLLLVDLALRHVVAPARDQGAAPRQAAGVVEHRALPVVPDGDLPRPAALGPRRLQHDRAAPVRVRRHELDGLFPAQPERRLQPQRHPHVRIPHQRQAVRVQRAALVAVGDVRPVADAVVGVTAAHARPLDVPRPPAQVRHAVLERPRRDPLAPPLAHQRVHVLAPQPRGAQPPEPEVVQRVRRLGQRERAVPPGDEAALPVPLLQAFQVEVQLPHAALPARVGRSLDRESARRMSHPPRSPPDGGRISRIPRRLRRGRVLPCVLGLHHRRPAGQFPGC